MKMQTYKRLFQTLLAVGAFGFFSGNALAKISEPDHILYGSATYFNSALANGSEISLIVSGQSEPLVSYSMGSETAFGNFYALHIPMDSIEPRASGTARPGEQVTIYIDGEVAAIAQVGEHGKAVRLDIDPNNLLGGGPGASVNDVSVNEGDAGESNLIFTVALSTSTDQHVSVEWVTSDLDAVGGADCVAGVDYISASGVATVLSGNMDTNFAINVCGDTQDEVDERFQVTLSNPQNGFIADGNGYATILDDDTRPTLSIDDVQVVEPASGAVDAVFTVSLSQVWNATVSVDYLVAPQTATAGADFTAVSGTVTIATGNAFANILVPVLADSVFEPNETFRVTLQNPVNGDLFDETGIGTIIDPAFEPMLVIAQDVPLSSSGPSAVVVSPDGKHVYVAGYLDDSITVFERQQGTGALSYLDRYDSTVNGFATVLLNGVSDIAVSADGAYLYATAYLDDAVNVFMRDGATGDLALIETHTDTLLGGAASLVLSPGNQHVYVAAEDTNSLSVYARDSVSGRLTFVEVKIDGVALVDGLGWASSVITSVDGRHVYVAGSQDNAVAIFSRDNVPVNITFGQLSYLGQVKDDIAGVSGISDASSVAISADGAYLYVTGAADNALAQFEREPWTGELSWIAQKTHGDDGVAGLQGPVNVQMSNDGNYVYALGLTDSSLLVFKRNRDHESADFGSLRVIQNIIDGQNGVAGLYQPSDMAVSPDDQHLYIATSNSVLVIQRKPVLIFGNSFN